MCDKETPQSDQLAHFPQRRRRLVFVFILQQQSQNAGEFALDFPLIGTRGDLKQQQQEEKKPDPN